MRKIARLVIGVLAAVNVCMTTAFAAVPATSYYTSVDQESVLCAKGVKFSTGTEKMLQEEGFLSVSRCHYKKRRKWKYWCGSACIFEQTSNGIVC